MAEYLSTVTDPKLRKYLTMYRLSSTAWLSRKTDRDKPAAKRRETECECQGVGDQVPREGRLSLSAKGWET